ncbi:MAG: radical SAM protein [Myxococcales bacterium]|nr:radical SAM protein [Myxococcales bacterium]
MDERDAIAARVVQNARGAGAGGAGAGGQALGPWTLEVYPTLRCNLACTFCDTTDRHRPPQNERSPERWTAIIDEAADLGAQRIMVLGGGEPLLALATPAILRRARERGLAGFLTTNGTRLARFVPLLAEICWDDVHVSVDGATPATHDRLRGQQGALRQTLRGLCLLRQRSPTTRLALHTVVTRENLDELTEITRLAASLGCQRVEFDHLIAYRPEQSRLALDPEQIAELPSIVAEIAEVSRQLGVETTAAALLTPRGAAPPKSTRPGLAGAPCLKAWHHLVIQADGRASPCCVLAGEGEEVTSVAASWRSDPFIQRVRGAMLAGTPLPRCRECSENILVHERAIRDRLPAAS